MKKRGGKRDVLSENITRLVKQELNLVAGLTCHGLEKEIERRERKRARENESVVIRSCGKEMSKSDMWFQTLPGWCSR